MAWVEFHGAKIKRLKKFHDFRTAVRWSAIESLGFLGSFWSEVIEVCESGDVTGWTPSYLAQVTGLKDSLGERVWDALVTYHWLDKRPDERIVVHDWLDYAGSFLRGKYHKDNRERLVEIWAFHGRSYGEPPSKLGDDRSPPMGNPWETHGKPIVPYLTLPNQKIKTKEGGGKPVENSTAHLEVFMAHFTKAMKTKLGRDPTPWLIKKAYGVAIGYLKTYPDQVGGVCKDVDILQTGMLESWYLASLRRIIGDRNHEQLKKLSAGVG